MVTAQVSAPNTSDEKKLSGEQIRELQAQLSQDDIHKDNPSEAPKHNGALTAQGKKGKNSQEEWIIDSRAFHHMKSTNTFENISCPLVK